MKLILNVNATKVFQWNSFYYLMLIRKLFYICKLDLSLLMHQDDDNFNFIEFNMFVLLQEFQGRDNLWKHFIIEKKKSSFTALVCTVAMVLATDIT